MSGAPANVHGTAIVVGTTGLIFLGPSGSGKSILAFDCLCEARSAGQFAALVSDDRVLISRHGDCVVATRPNPIKDLIELRHAGIGRFRSIPRTVLSYAVLPINRETADRLPPENARVALCRDTTLPAIHLPTDVRLPFAFINALIGAEVPLI